MSCQQVPTAPAFNPYPRSIQVGEFEVAITGGIWVAIRGEFWFNAMGWFGRYGCHFVISFHPSSHEISPRQVHKILFLQILSLRCR